MVAPGVKPRVEGEYRSEVAKIVLRRSPPISSRHASHQRVSRLHLAEGSLAVLRVMSGEDMPRPAGRQGCGLPSESSGGRHQQHAGGRRGGSRGRAGEKGSAVDGLHARTLDTAGRGPLGHVTRVTHRWSLSSDGGQLTPSALVPRFPQRRRRRRRPNPAGATPRPALLNAHAPRLCEAVATYREKSCPEGAGHCS